MDINVTIKCPDLPLAAAALAKAISGLAAPAVLTPKADIDPEAVNAAMQAAPAQIMTPQPTVAPTNPTPAMPPDDAVNASAPAQTNAPAPTAVPAATAYPSSPTAVPTTSAPQITGDMVAKAGADLIAANPAAFGPLNSLLQKYGVSCAQELRPDQIGPFATEMRALGAKL